MPHWFEVRGGSWQVSLATVQRVRELVDAEIKRNRFFYPDDAAPRFAIQFRGETIEGRQVVQVRGSCNALGKITWHLSDRFTWVGGGGNCYFEADCRLEDGRFRFGYHGHR